MKRQTRRPVVRGLAVLLMSGAITAANLTADSHTVEVRGALPVVRLFCAPCYDRYAHQMPAVEVAWGVAPESDDAAPRAAVRTLDPPWRRAEAGSLVLTTPPAPGGDERVVMVINGGVFDPALVYVYFDGQWRNVAIHFGLADGGAMATLPGYIRVERAPFEEAPTEDDRLFSRY